MILFVMGILDLIAGISVFLVKFGLFTSLGFVLGIYLILKGVLFIKDVSSILDIISGIVIILLFYGCGVPFYWLFSLWLIQKGLFSLMS